MLSRVSSCRVCRCRPQHRLCSLSRTPKWCQHYTVFLVKKCTLRFAEVASRKRMQGLRVRSVRCHCHPVAVVVFTLPVQCGLCYNCSIVLCTLGARTPLDAQREAPLSHQKNVFSGTGIFQIISGLCYDTRQFVTFYTILPYRPHCSVTVGLPRFLAAGSAAEWDAAHKQA